MHFINLIVNASDELKMFPSLALYWMSYGLCIMSYFGIHHSRYPYSEHCCQFTKHAHTHTDTHTHTTFPGLLIKLFPCSFTPFHTVSLFRLWVDTTLAFQIKCPFSREFRNGTQKFLSLPRTNRLGLHIDISIFLLCN